MRLTGNRLIRASIALFVVWLAGDLAWRMHTYCYNMRAADQIAMEPLFAAMYADTLTWEELWQQHNEHRILFPRILLLALGRITGWNVNYELLLNYGFACATFALVLALLARMRRQLHICQPCWLLPTLAVLHFSLAQCENWLFGMNMVIYLNVCCVVAALSLLAVPKLHFPGFLAALAMAVVASGTFANGLLLWLLGTLQLLVLHRRRLAYTAGWALCGSAVITVYLTGYFRPAHHPSPVFPDENPAGFASYLFTYLGSPVSNGSAAMLAGACGIIVLSAALWVLYRRQVPLSVVLPLVSLAAYAVGSGALTALGRTGFGITQALTGRYVTISLLLWVVSAAALYLVAETTRRGRWCTRAGRLLRVAAVLTVVAMTVGGAWRSWTSRHEFPARHHFLVQLELADMREGMNP